MTKPLAAMAACMFATLRTAVVVLSLGAGAAFAEYRETVPVLRIGVVESHVGLTNPLKIQAVQQAFSKTLGIPVEIMRMRSYAALVDAHASGRVGYAVHSARSYAATAAACGCVKPLRTPVASDGSTGFRSVLVVRDGVTSSISELRIAYSNEDSVSGWQIPHQAMQAGSLDSPRLVRAGTVEATIELYGKGGADGFFGWVPDIPAAAGSDPSRLFGGWDWQATLENDPVRVIWSSQRIPYGPHAVHRSLPDDLVAALGEFLDQMPASAPGLLDIFEPFFAGGYVIADPQDYENLRGLVVTQSDSGNG
ncbi:phosphate/phosphite/phosphonate ABC transporter substrate-binding protein [Hoeflea sp.]|uniref:phosphate/phosphite/phosphonate ABC transporter substrate-binding protein n=1 Tax=Hoeflea sp. TaxID=1940281 RepID=UPI003749372A